MFSPLFPGQDLQATAGRQSFQECDITANDTKQRDAEDDTDVDHRLVDRTRSFPFNHRRIGDVRGAVQLWPDTSNACLSG